MQIVIYMGYYASEEICLCRLLPGLTMTMPMTMTMTMKCNQRDMVQRLTAYRQTVKKADMLLLHYLVLVEVCACILFLNPTGGLVIIELPGFLRFTYDAMGMVKK